MLRTIVIVLLVVMVTVPADAEWEMSEFVIFLGWAESVECPDDEAMMQAIAQADFNVVMWYDANQLDLAHKYGLKLLVQPGLHEADQTIADRCGYRDPEICEVHRFIHP